MNKSHRSWLEEVIQLSNQVIQFPSLGIAQLLRRSNQNRMNHFVKSLIWIHKVVENHQEVESHRSWHEEVIPLSNQVIPVSQFGNSTASSSFKSNQDESLCKKLDLDT